MSESKPVAVVGGGIFGAMTALRLAECGAQVTLFERSDTLLRGASSNNQNRLHLGFHYPRDDETARQCIRGFRHFQREFGNCTRERFVNAYFVASAGSHTTPASYLDFCRRMDLRHDLIDLAAFQPRVQGVDLGLACDELVYDCDVLRDTLLARLDGSAVRTLFNAEVDGISRRHGGFELQAPGRSTESFAAVVNCTYADVNRLTAQLGHAPPDRQYEYTVVPIIEWDEPPVGITIMDGQFLTVLPYGHKQQFLLYHVAHTVVERFVGPQMPQSWLNAATSPASRLDIKALFERMRDSCLPFVPALATARLAGFLKGPRVVKAHQDATDARPSIVHKHEPGYLSAFTGKIDHCIWVAEEIVGELLGPQAAARQATPRDTAAAH